MGIWDDVGAQTGIWTGYAGLSPQDALNKWYQTQQQMRAAGFQPGQQGPGGEMLGSMVNLNQQNPEAFRLAATGTQPTRNAQGQNQRTVFNPQTGQWDTQDVRGVWSHPETWAQIALGGAFGAAAPGAFAGTAASGGAPVSAAAPAAASTAGEIAPEAATAASVGPEAAGFVPGDITSASQLAAGGAGGGTLSSLGRLAPYLIAGGTNLAGGILGSHAANTAAQQQLAAGRQAMSALGNAYGQQLGFYGQQRDVYSPYVQIGQGALNNLAGLTGIQRPTTPAPNPTMVRMRAPDGSVQAVNSNDVQHYIQRGATIA